MKIILLITMFCFFISCGETGTGNNPSNDENNESSTTDIEQLDHTEQTDDVESTDRVENNDEIEQTDNIEQTDSVEQPDSSEQNDDDNHIVNNENTFSVSFEVIDDGMDPYTDIIFGDKKGNVFYSKRNPETLTKNTGSLKDLLKLDPTGALVWQTPLDLPASHEVYVYDYEFSEKSFSILVAGTIRLDSKLKMFLIKISAAGFPSWVKLFETEGEGWIMPYTIATDSDDNTYVGGSIVGHLSDTSSASDNNINTRNSDALVIKVNKNGNILWSRQTQNTNTDLVFGLSVDKNDNLYLTGTENVTSGDYAVNCSNHGTGMFLSKWDKNGSEIWRVEQNHEKDQIHGMSVGMLDNDVAILGHRCLPSSITDDGCNYQPFLARYNTNGEKIWEKSWISGRGLQSVTNATNMVISGNKIYTIHNAWEFSGHNSDIMLTIFDGSGKELSNKIIASQCQDYPNHISALPGDAIMITGITDGWFGDSIETSDCEWEVFRPFVMILKPE